MTIAVIGGTGLGQLSSQSSHAAPLTASPVETPYGKASAPIIKIELSGKEALFLARHGQPHSIPPHQINYRANMYALKEAGATEVIAVNAVGGIHSQLGPQGISIPDQVIDYTYGREHTYYDGRRESISPFISSPLEHVDFTYPYSNVLRNKLLDMSRELELKVLDGGIYAATQGPRLESAAEIKRISNDGGDMVGMTGMPEAALARELDLEYACIALSVNWCAGLTEELITMDDIRQALDGGIDKVKRLIFAFIDAQG